MSRLCLWGMHLPGARKVFHRGHLFTRCSDCGETLMAGHKGWHAVPRGKRVVWRDRTGDDRLFAESANHQRTRLPFRPLFAFRPALTAIQRRRPGA